MSIYTRDNINYGGMLGNAMANRANYLQRKYDRVAQMGQNWGNAIQQTGQAIGNAFNQAAQYQYNKDQLANQQQFQSEQNALNRANQLQLAREQQAEALKRAQEQQKFQAEQNALNRANQIELVKLSNQRSGNNVDESILQARNQMNYDIAEAEYMDAISKVDMSKPETVLAAKKAALKLNFNAQQLPYYDPKVHNVMTDFTEDAPGVTRIKSIQSAKSRMDAIKKLKPSQWSDEQRQEYMDAYATLLDLEPESAKDYEVVLLNKGGTTGDAARGKQQYIANLNSGKLKFDNKNKYGVKEEVIKDPTTGQWIKIYK